jgi:hypothetical protein
MRILLLGLITIVITSILPAKTYSLDYQIEGLDECLSQQINTPECAEIICTRDNIERNWPKDTGYYEDCSGKRNTILALALIGGVILAVGVVVILKKKTKK